MGNPGWWYNGVPRFEGGKNKGGEGEEERVCRGRGDEAMKEQRFKESERVSPIL